MRDRRASAATATVGAVGVGGAAALRHEGLVRSYGERSEHPVARPKWAGERRMISHRGGRGHWLAGAGLGLVALPALATGVNGALRPTRRTVTAKRDNERRGFLREGVSGARAAVIDRADTVREKAPAKLVAGNYAAGVGVGAVAGGLTHAALRSATHPGHHKSALAAIAAGVTGTAALPLQSRLTQHYSHGQYKVTPTGVRRAKRAPKRPSSQATVIDSKLASPAAFRSQTVGKAAWKAFHPVPPVRGGGTRKIPASQLSFSNYLNRRVATDRRGREVGWIKTSAQSPEIGGVLVHPGFRRRGVGTRMLEEARSRHPVEHSVDRSIAGNAWARSVERKRAGKLAESELEQQARARRPQRTQGEKQRGRLPITERVRGYRVRSGPEDVRTASGVRNNKARPVGRVSLGKRVDDRGASMSRNERRARVAAAGPPIPVIGDIIQAHTAGQLSPAKYRHRTSAQNFTSGQAGTLTGNLVGGGAALGAARLSPGFDRGAKKANDRIDAFRDSVRSRAYSSVGRTPGTRESMTRRVLGHKNTPHAVRRGAAALAGSPLGRAVARNPKVAAVGALAGGMVGGPAAQQTMLGHTMSRDDRYRRSLAKRAATAPAPIPLSQRESHQLRRRKEAGAAASMFTGTTGIAALGTTLGTVGLKHGRIKHVHWAKPARKRLKRATLPLVAVGGGVGGLNSFNYANIQRQEAHQIRKALVPSVAGIRRAPAMRRATLRQTRNPGGMIRTSTVRGGLA